MRSGITNMTTADELIAALALDHKNHDLYLIVADRLEEEGQWELSQVYRWCGMTKHYPEQDYDHFDWYIFLGNDPNSNLPDKEWVRKIDLKKYGLMSFAQSIAALIPFLEEMKHHENAI